MEEYSDIEIDTSDACVASRAPDATPTTMTGPEHEATYPVQQVRQLGEKVERSRLGKLRVFRPTSGNAAARFRLKAKQELRVTTRAGKFAEAVIKQLASQKLQGGKEKMEGWKANVMQEVARKLQVIRQVHEDAIMAQRQNFQAELERLESVWQLKPELLENKIRLLKSPGLHKSQVRQGQQAARNTPTPNQNPSSNDNAQGDEHSLESDLSTPESEPVKSPSGKNARSNPVCQIDSNKKQSYAAVAAAQPTEASSQAWTKVSYNNRKTGVQKSPTLGKAK